MILQEGLLPQRIMNCSECGQYLSEAEIFSHDCTTDAVVDVEQHARSLYERLLRQPSVSLHGGYGSTVAEGTAKDDMLRCGLSNIVGGPPLQVVPNRLLSREHAQHFVTVATAVLKRVNDGDSDYLHYSDPPSEYKLLAAVLRQATRAEHVVALLVALSAPRATPHLLLPVDCWRRYDEAILSDVEFAPIPQVLRSLEAELRSITFNHRHDSDDALGASRSFLWKGRDEFIAAVLHAMLSSRMEGGLAFALPPLSESEVGSWLPRFTELVAAVLGSITPDVMKTEVATAVAFVNANPLTAFATCRLAQALPKALKMLVVECVTCALVVPADCVVRCGGRVLCKLCFEASARVFARDPASQTERDDYKLALSTFRTTIADEVFDAVSLSIAAAEKDVTFDARFHCPLNARHQTPFHAPMPEHPDTPGAPVGITCPECSITWCAQCKCVDHPHAATCGEVTNAKHQWSVYSDNMTRFANVVLGEHDSEAAAMKLAVTDRAAAVERRRALLQTQIARIQREIGDIDGAIRQIHLSNHAEMAWAGDGGYPKVIGSRRCPHCGRQPIKRVQNCQHMVCGQNSYGGNFQGGCLSKFDYCSPEAAYRPISSANEEAERAKLQGTLNQLTAHLAGVDSQTNFPPPELANHWPSLSCSSCKKGLLGDFYVQCYHCEPPHLLCVYCVRGNKHNDHADPAKESGHVLAIRKP
ncbi:Hypothetical protein, putative [Bodo saltans]|uniref:Uncharacterized protein n=1 Tax=Bodo saltans TaxID=75058 RepID=A0A0S4JJL4_BODSA|nr:Hypothetical protein, putative [Bodo saltans]|eukprot:CUG90388.1 Hypothetical protein, putative [Bodo saltans]